MPLTTPETSRAIGPTVSRLGANGRTPSRGTRRRVVLRPAVPQKAEGILIEPPLSEPKAISATPVATATAEPLEEPPGTSAGLRGLTGVPMYSLMPDPP